jgi:predicted nucleotidyltransferase
MIERLITSRTRVKLLKLFFMNREREFYLRELARTTGENLNSVGRELKNLLASGIISERDSGNMKLYRVNALSPVHEELRMLVLKTVGVGDALREGLSAIGSIKYCLIYGSFAAGGEVGESDIDLLVIGDMDEETLLKVIKNLEEKLRREINYILWGERGFVKKAGGKHHLILDIMQKPFIMIIGDEDEFRGYAKGKADSKNKG